MTPEQLSKIDQWCQLAHDRDGTAACIEAAVDSLYWGGENDRHVSINFCNVIQKKDFQNVCFTNLIGTVGLYISDPVYKKSFCQELPKEYQPKCQIDRKEHTSELQSPDHL